MKKKKEMGAIVSLYEEQDIVGKVLIIFGLLLAVTLIIGVGIFVFRRFGMRLGAASSGISSMERQILAEVGVGEEKISHVRKIMERSGLDFKSAATWVRDGPREEVLEVDPHTATMTFQERTYGL